MLPRCSALTKKGKQCPNLVELEPYDGVHLCHVHHPWGTFQLQLLKQKAEKGKRLANETKVITEHGIKPLKHPDYTEMLESLRRQKGLSEPNRR